MLPNRVIEKILMHQNPYCACFTCCPARQTIPLDVFRPGLLGMRLPSLRHFETARVQYQEKTEPRPKLFKSETKAIKYKQKRATRPGSMAIDTETQMNLI